MARQDNDRNQERNQRMPQPRMTLPLALDTHERIPYAPPGFRLTEMMRFPVWRDCERCAGHGTVERVGSVVCRTHRLAWSVDDLARMAGAHWRKLKRLPCECPVDGGEPQLAYPPCPDCLGAGGFTVLVTLDMGIEWMLRFIAANYEWVDSDSRISQIVTARRPSNKAVGGW